MGRTRTGAEELRLIVRNMDDARESFNDRFTAEELLQIYRMHLASGWDFPPDRWTERQVEGALAGKAPSWDEHEEPAYDIAAPLTEA